MNILLHRNKCFYGRAVACQNYKLMIDQTQLKILQLLQKHPNMTQRELSNMTGVSLGKVNFIIKALKDKGLIKWQNFSNSPNKLQYAYLLTPQGIFEKTQLTLEFLNRKQAEYEVLKQEIEQLIKLDLSFNKNEPLPRSVQGE